MRRRQGRAGSFDYCLLKAKTRATELLMFLRYQGMRDVVEARGKRRPLFRRLIGRSRAFDQLGVISALGMQGID